MSLVHKPNKKKLSFETITIATTAVVTAVVFVFFFACCCLAKYYKIKEEKTREKAFTLPADSIPILFAFIFCAFVLLTRFLFP